MCIRDRVEIGRRLARLAQTHQVVVVTHLAQVAAYADRQLMVDKGATAREDEGVTRSSVRTLDDAERVVELARMLAGTEETETGRAHAEELLAAAARDKGDGPATGASTPPPTPITKGVTKVSRGGGGRPKRRAG